MRPPVEYARQIRRTRRPIRQNDRRTNLLGLQGGVECHVTGVILACLLVAEEDFAELLEVCGRQLFFREQLQQALELTARFRSITHVHVSCARNLPSTHAKSACRMRCKVTARPPAERPLSAAIFATEPARTIAVQDQLSLPWREGLQTVVQGDRAPRRVHGLLSANLGQLLDNAVGENRSLAGPIATVGQHRKVGDPGIPRPESSFPARDRQLCTTVSRRSLAASRGPRPARERASKDRRTANLNAQPSRGRTARTAVDSPCDYPSERSWAGPECGVAHPRPPSLLKYQIVGRY